MNRTRKISIVVLLLLGIWQWEQAGVIAGKAVLAKWLIAHAWEKSIATGDNIKPWPWADTWPVAKITFSNNQYFYVLAGGTGNSLAFGPGHLSDTALPGTMGASVIGGHRDTHFSLLENIHLNDMIEVENQRGEIYIYRIENTWIANTKKQDLLIDPEQNSLYLITCYPFRAIRPGGDERFMIKALRVEIEKEKEVKNTI